MTGAKHHIHSLTGLLRIRVSGAQQVAVNRLLYGFVVPVLIVWLISNVVQVPTMRLAGGAACIAAGFMMMRVPAVTFTEERETGLHRLLVQTAHIRPSGIMAMLMISAVPLALLPVLSFFTVVHATGADVAPQNLMPLAVLALWFFGLGLCLIALRLSLIATQLVADLLIVAIVVFCPVFYGAADTDSWGALILNALPPTLFLNAVHDTETGAAIAPLMALSVWAMGTVAIGYVSARRCL